MFISRYLGLLYCFLALMPLVAAFMTSGIRYIATNSLLHSTSPDKLGVSDLSVASPVESSFLLFYEETVPFGSALSLDQFLQHQEVEGLIERRQLLVDDVSDIWISLWGCNCKCLSEGDAFQTLCAVYESIDVVP